MTGRRIVAALGEEQPVRALVRSREKGREVLPGSVELAEGDVLRPETLSAALAGVRTLFCATGTRTGFGANGAQQVDFEGTVALVDAARSAGVEHFVLVSSLCVSRLLHPLNLFGGVLIFKKRAEEHLIRSGLPFTIVRPGGLRDGAGGAEIVVSPADTLFEGTIDRADVARVCVEASRSDTARDKIVEIVSGPGAAQSSLERQFAQLPTARPRAAV
jgi:uncharacterized protein YbjT (DUF2867 family)